MPRARRRFTAHWAHAGVDDLDITCAWQHAFNVAPNRKGPFGYLLELSGLGGLILGKDIVVWNPLAGTSQSLLGGATVSCVGVIERCHGGDITDPNLLRLSGGSARLDIGVEYELHVGKRHLSGQRRRVRARCCAISCRSAR